MLADLEEAGDVVEEAEDEDWKDVEDDSPVPPEPGLERVADAAESLHTDGDSEVGGGEESAAAESDHHIGHIGVPVIQLPRPEQDRNRPEKWGEGVELPGDAGEDNTEDEDHVDQGQADD